MPSSAQWMSSHASTSGSSCAIASTNARTAPKNASRALCSSSRARPESSASGSSMPTSRAIGAMRRRTSSSSPFCASSGASRPESFCHASSEGSPSAIEHSARTISLNGQYTTLEPNGRQRPPRTSTGFSRAASARSNSRNSRDLPTPAWPKTVISCGASVRATRANSVDSAESSSARPTSGACWRTTRAPPVGCTSIRSARQAATGSALPFSASGSSGAYSTTPLVARCVRSPTVIVPGLALDCRRAATLTASPITV